MNGPNHHEVGTVVEYVDEYGVSHEAILTSVWGEVGVSAVNLVYVSEDETKTDPWGRQIERAASVSVEGPATAHGRFYRVK